ncbi:hypothetical protein BD414DRAFT_34891 [Trametes punicea]|nr:hypothetical protein BD414DRAFT_34891 [Trametes punicea]
MCAMEQHIPGPAISSYDGLVIYIGLRPIPRHTKATEMPKYQSFVALNKWPCGNMPAFSADIPVLSGHDDQFRLWDLRLLRMQIKEYDRKARMYTRPVDIPLVASTLSDDEGNIRITLDTGSSLSWLPYVAVQAIARYYDQEQIPQPLPEVKVYGDSPTKPAVTYLVPSERDSAYSLVVMHFRGRSEQIVTVEVPARYFLYVHNPTTSRTEGLIFARREPREWILGANFFHSTWVALHKPNSNLPFVRIAAQDHSTAGVDRYQLPPPTL